MTPTPELPPLPAPAPAPTPTSGPGVALPPRPTGPETVVGRLLREGAAATVERTDVAPTQLAALRTEIRRSSSEDRRLIFGAIDAKLRQDLHAEVRTGLTALRNSVGAVEQFGLTAREMVGEIPSLVSLRSTTGTGDRLRAAAWLAAIVAGLSSFGAAARGKIGRFIALLGIPFAAIALRMHGMDPLQTNRRAPRPGDTPEAPVAFDERLAPDVNLLNRFLAYRREGEGGGDRQLRITSPRNGLRFEQGGRTFGMYNSADAAARELEPFVNVNSVNRDADGGASIRTVRLGGTVTVTMHMAPTSFAALGTALDAPGDAIRTADLAMTIRRADITGPATLANIKAELERKGATVTMAPDSQSITWTSRAHLRPLSAAEIADVTSAPRRIPGPGATPAPAPM